MEDYKDFISKFLKNKSGVFGFTDELLGSFLHKDYHYIQSIFSDEEISTMAIANFETCLLNSDHLTEDLWRHFWNCQERKVVSSSTDGVSSIQYPIQKKAIQKLRRFIVHKDRDSFLFSTITEEPFDGLFGIEPLNIKTIFNSELLFISLFEKMHTPQPIQR